MNLAPLLPLFALGACAAQGTFPSLNPRPAEQERVIAAPGAGLAADLSAEERRSIADDLATANAAFAAAKAAIRPAEAALQAAMPLARNAPIGSDPWANAQMLLSRFQDARAGLDVIDARLAPALLLSDDLPDTDPDRATIFALRAAIAEEIARTAAVATAAEASLARG